jgi:hypothetical protein
MKRFSILMSVVSLAGCASSGNQAAAPSGAAFWVKARSEKTPFARVINAPVQQVAQHVAPVITGMGFPGAFAGGPEFIYITKQLDVKSRLYEGEKNSAYFECGETSVGTLIADNYSITFTLLAHLSATADGKTNAEVLLDASARDPSQAGTNVPCRGTGKLENTVLQALAARSQ